MHGPYDKIHSVVVPEVIFFYFQELEMEPDYSSAYDSSSSLSSSTSIGSPIPPLGRLYSEIIHRTGSNLQGQGR